MLELKRIPLNELLAIANMLQEEVGLEACAQVTSRSVKDIEDVIAALTMLFVAHDQNAEELVKAVFTMHGETYKDEEDLYARIEQFATEVGIPAIKDIKLQQLKSLEGKTVEKIEVNEHGCTLVIDGKTLHFCNEVIDEATFKGTRGIFVSLNGEFVAEFPEVDYE